MRSETRQGATVETGAKKEKKKKAPSPICITLGNELYPDRKRQGSKEMRTI